ncbi:amidohydrolase family protein [Rubrivirga marina]|uniref:Amidohydrolase-related domain-containing protein n=1 Tax=Rubrivirga marina TaxID=1196024 RepID=A0A271J199_9BACT|nr:amidohydrolase family protein [Rubrivirga marina]PAP77233.1 hypothetical protein BSZ37_12715 [Rubrivirga marina]
MRLHLYALIVSAAAAAQPAPDRRPVLDMHLHALPADEVGPPPVAMCVPMLAWAPERAPDQSWLDAFGAFVTDPPCPAPFWSNARTDREVLEGTLEVMERRNIIGVLSGPPRDVLWWHEAAPDRFIPSAQLQFGRDAYAPDSLRALFVDGPFEVLGEVSNQYVGVAPNDPQMDPYWAFMAEHDLPVAIHLGEGPFLATVLYPGYRPSLSSPYLLEDVLHRHPTLRISVMHYGSPLVDEMIAMMGAYPQLYVDLGGIQWFYARAYFYEQLRQFVDAGLARRVMFGSDHVIWPGLLEESIDIVEDAPFLSDEQKRDILYHNAARFLRLSDETIARHHAM